jgi:hypothetical protein
LRSSSGRTMKGIEALRKQLDELADVANRGAIPSSDANGNRAWIRGRGCGIVFMREIIHAQRNKLPFTADQLEQIDLWSRAEVDTDRFGGIARANRELARDILGLEHGAHL